MSIPSVVVEVIDKLYVSADEAENDPPIAGNAHRLESSQLTFERMQTHSGFIHIAWLRGDIQGRQYAPQPGDVVGTHTSGATVEVQSLQALVLEGLDHRQTVKKHFTCFDVRLQKIALQL